VKRLAFLATVAVALTLTAVLLLRVTSQRGSSTATNPPGIPAIATATNPAPQETVSNSAPVRTVAAQFFVSPPADDGLSAITNFSSWAGHFLAGNPSIRIAQGQALAWKRREAMLKLIENDPQQALEMAVPFHWRRELPAEVTRYFEARMDGRGDLQVVMAEGSGHGKAASYRYVHIGERRYDAFVYGWRLKQVSQQQVPLHGIALDGKLALLADPVRVLEADEAAELETARGRTAVAACAVCGQPSGVMQQETVADVGGETALFCSHDHVALANERLRVAESGGDGSAGQRFSFVADETWTKGPKTVLYMRLNFPDDLTEPISESDAYDVMNEVNAFYVEGSYRTTSLSPMVTPLITLPQTKAWYSAAGPGALLDDARDTARRAGFDTRSYDLDIATFTKVPDFDWAGLGVLYGKGTWLQSQGQSVTAHELGHNYGLVHASFWDTTTNGSVIGVATNIEYGNIFDVMGGGGLPDGHFSALFKNELRWIPDDSVHDVTSNGVYRIHAFDVPVRTNRSFYGLKIRKDFDRSYWAEFRQSLTDNAESQYGVLLDWAPWSLADADLLDTTPNSSGGPLDAALVIGRTFSDKSSGVHITPVARGATGTNLWMDVAVNLGTFTTNQPPVLKVELDRTNAATGAIFHFHATATDPDGDPLSYAWQGTSFLSETESAFSTNNLPWTFRSWPTAGERVIRCAVSDMKGGVASANAVVRVGNPPGFRIGGLVTDTNGEPEEGVFVSTGSLGDTNLLGGYTDSRGRYVIVGVTGEVSLRPVKYGIVFTNESWENPVTISSNVMNLDFTVFPLPAVRIAVSTNAVSESSSAKQRFTLTHNGDTNSDFAVQVLLSATADITKDCALTPVPAQATNLVAGTNTIVIPAGTNSITIEFRASNDQLVEPAETVALIVFEDAAYTVAPPGEASITILDDDQTGLPRVSVSVATGRVLENGMDKGGFVFSRSGGPQGDLPVYYTVGGTATAGADYSSLLGVVVIPAGRSAATVQFQPFDDADAEADETVIATLVNNAAYITDGPPAVVTIANDDVQTVTIFPTDGTASEPSATGRLTVKRDGDVTANLMVNYAVGGTATGGVDYQPLSGSVMIPAGAESADIVLTPINDALLEGDESVIVSLTDHPGCNIGTPNSATIFIRDDEKPVVSVTATDVTASEPGADTAMFQVSRGSVVNGNLTVKLGISGSAINGVDYVPLNDTVVIPDGANHVVLEVVPFDDLQIEYEEDVILTLAASTNYVTGSPSRARVSIVDEDTNSVPAVGFTLTASSAEESRSPGIIVALSYKATNTVTVDYFVVGGTASNTDFVLPPSPLVFATGELAKPILLSNRDNSIPQPDRTVRLVLFNPINATLDGIKFHTYTILDDDTAAVSIAATAANASETGPVPGNFRISRPGSAATNVTVNFEVTGTAAAPGDYAPLGTSVTIPAGTAFVDLPVVPVSDLAVEPGETVVVRLTTAPGAKIVSPSVATVTIHDDQPDERPVVSVASAAHPYAVEGGGNGEFVFTRSGSTTGALAVAFSINGTAVSGTDYLAITNVVAIPVGASSVAIPVVPVDDNLIEGEETVVATLTVVNTYRVAYPSSATVTLQDNDQKVRLDASDFVAAEPGVNRGEFTFTRFGTTNTALQVFFAISGTASNGVDYAAVSNSFVIPPGKLTTALPIVPLDDVLREGHETVTLTLSSNAAYKLDPPASATVTILDDEPMVRVAATVTNTLEGGRKPGIFTLTREGDPSYEFTVHLSVGGAARYGLDYAPFGTNIFFSCGIVEIDLPVEAFNEVVPEPNERVTVAILPDPAYTILSPSNAVLTIEDVGNNQTPLVTITRPRSSTVFIGSSNANMILEATVTDVGGPNTPPVLTWSKVRGPDTFYFGDITTNNTTVSFTNAGYYVLRLTADDGQLQGYGEVEVYVDIESALGPDILHWRLDDGSGMSALDSSGFGRHGQLVGNANWVAGGGVDGALELDGANAYVREASGTNFLDGLRAFTLMLWVNTADTNRDQGLLAGNDSGTGTTLGLNALTHASCGGGTNVFEANLPTSDGVGRCVTLSGNYASGWHHLALTWASGGAPALFVNGELDQPNARGVAVAGHLVNCPQFIVGKGPPEMPNGWNGLVDDVRLFNRALSTGEVWGVGGGCCGDGSGRNTAPLVDAGTNAIFQIIIPPLLSGTVTDDGLPDPPATVSNEWVMVSGPQPAIITDSGSLMTTVAFVETGDYVFRLIADDGDVKMYDDVAFTVTRPTQVQVFATDDSAAELGPDTGEFTFYREGDNTVELPVYFTFGGFASNGVDCVWLTNVVALAAGADSASLQVTPFLDDRIEGDEPLTLNIVSNAAYTIGNGSATVTIHDSPYGAWSVDHFTLEELTLPRLSSAGADFDHDGLCNFAEYAALREPKSAETNSPLVTTIELNPDDGKNHITLTYQRRLPPTDTAYAIYLSDDLHTWNTGTNYVEELQATDDGNGLSETVKARLRAPYPPSTNLFFTIRIRLLTTGP
jgi:Concanavalin A-like lectin/glucanases superfamily/Calx-beta domain